MCLILGLVTSGTAPPDIFDAASIFANALRTENVLLIFGESEDSAYHCRHYA